ncbi:hypothetical protein L1987_76725 [Smallanthus sonchifolius]|uniref:Uncharacterized protein n=1 Tax=Smallanthus sonchifolius TaxID=185202 RepID=A0ACB8Z883_9ASTR|nr:hypothetical protein L1987_76725 [Smallanthus sonchifolius]
MADSAETLPAAAESVSLYTKVIESTSCPKNSRLSTQTLDRKSSYCHSEADTQATESMLFNNLCSDEQMLYPSGAEANTLYEPLSSFDNNFVNIDGETDEWISCNQRQFEVYKPPPSVASSSSRWYEDGYEKPSMVVCYGAGLANLVNTCFFNAVLQCFTHSVLLVQGLYSHTHPTPCDCSNQRFCLICALREHIELSLSPTAKVVSPWKFIDNLSYLKLRCCNCNHISDTYEPSVDLSLEIEDVNSLSTALESYTKVEHIEDEEMKFTCDQCKQKVSVEKQLMLDQIPLICAFHLKRFKNDGSYVEKIEKHVEFPLELDLQPYTCGSQSDNVDLKYELYAVVVHAAFTSSCGHYYCYIRSAPDTWYMFDDSKVISVSEEHVLSEEAYILFYAKQGTPWFSNFMETYKPLFYPNLSTTSPKSVLENVDPPNIHSHDINASIDHPSHSDDVAPLKPINKVVKENPPLIVKKYGSNHRIEVQKNTCVTPINDSKTEFDIDELLSTPTPPRFSVLDISDDSDTEVVFAAKPKQLKLVEKSTFKRQRNNEAENPATLEAMRMCKRMPGARGELLMAAMSSKSESSLLKKSKKMVSSPRNNGSKSNDRSNSINRKLATSSFR